MPLPAALAARLAKRGILSKKDALNAEPAVVEEVIAEDYDDSKTSKPLKSLGKEIDYQSEFTQEEIRSKIRGYPGCPNKYNIFHECQHYCKERYGNGKLTPDQKYLRLKMKMLKKYPLPEGWNEIYDPGTGRYYYWEEKSDLVSWLPPAHPRHVLSEAAAVLREDVKLAETDEESVSDEDEDMNSEEEEPVKEKRHVNRYEYQARQRAKGRTKVKDNDLDPMDPASYSDIPRGTWSTGLERKGDAKTGVDVTASGPLFQQRPYPSPGEVLRSRGKPPPQTQGKNKPQVSFPELPD